MTPPAVAQETIALAPVSSVTTASATAPIPRFAAVQVQNDCKLLGGCKAPVVLPPRLLLEATPIHISAVGGGGAMTSPAGTFKVHNTGSGNMDWSISVIYQGGTGWLVFDSNVGNQRSHREGHGQYQDSDGRILASHHHRQRRKLRGARALRWC